MSSSRSSAGAPDSRESYDLDKLRAQDASELDRLVRAESGRIFRCIRRLIGDRDEAESLVQETFLQALRKIDGFRGDSKVSTWLCAIAVNLARASLRKSSRVDTLEEADIERLQPAFTDRGRHRVTYADWNPHAALERSQMRDLLHRAIDRLPETYRTAIVIRDIEEYSSAEAAQILNISEGALRVRLHRARLALRKLLDDQLSR